MFEFSTKYGVTKADLDETWGKFFLQASQSFLYSSRTSETTRNPLKPTLYVLEKTLTCFFGTGTSASKPLEPARGRKFHIESEFYFQISDC